MPDQNMPLIHVAQMVRARPGHRLLFVYNHLMDEAAMSHCCPDPQFITTARSMSRRLTFDLTGAATIIPRRNYAVHGVIWEISEVGLTGLDIQMGVPGIRDRFGAFNRAPDGRLVVSEFYATRDHRPGKPNPASVLRIVELAKRLSFPASYLRELAGWLRRDLRLHD